MMVRNLTFVDTITLTVLHGGEILAGITARVKYPIGAGAPRGGGPVQRPGGGLGMVGAVPAIAPRARTSTGSAASKHDQHPGFAGVQRPLKALSSEQLLNGWLYYYKNCGITCVK